MTPCKIYVGNVSACKLRHVFKNRDVNIMTFQYTNLDCKLLGQQTMDTEGINTLFDPQDGPGKSALRRIGVSHNSTRPAKRTDFK